MRMQTKTKTRKHFIQGITIVPKFDTSVSYIAWRIGNLIWRLYIPLYPFYYSNISTILRSILSSGYTFDQHVTLGRMKYNSDNSKVCHTNKGYQKSRKSQLKKAFVKYMRKEIYEWVETGKFFVDKSTRSPQTQPRTKGRGGIRRNFDR